MGSYQIKKTFFEIKNPRVSPAIIDVLGSCRPKIYALLQLLKTRHKEKVEIANGHYKLLNEPISLKDQVGLLFHDLRFRSGLKKIFRSLNWWLKTI